MKKRRLPSMEFLLCLDQPPATQHVSFTWRLARKQRHRSRAVRIFLPERFDFFVRVLPVRHGRAPITEYHRDLNRRAFFTWHCKDVANFFRQRIGLHFAISFRRADAETAEVVVHVVVAIPTAVVLLKADAPIRSVREAGRFLCDEYRFAILIAPARSHIDAPRRFVFAIDGELDWSRAAAVRGLVVEVRFECALWLLDVRGRLLPLHLQI